MEAGRNECLQETYIEQKIAEILSIDYDENQLLAAEFSDNVCHQRRGTLADVK